MTPEVMDRPRCRRFSIGDLMILILAAALWLAMARPALMMLPHLVKQTPHGPLVTWSDWQAYLFGKNRFALAWLSFANMAVLQNAFVIALPAFLIIRLRRPRPALSAILRQPGFVGCLAPVAMGLGLFLAQAIAGYLGRGALIAMAAATPVAWLILAALRKWTPEAGWIDRLGWFLALAWSVSIVFSTVQETKIPL